MDFKRFLRDRASSPKEIQEFTINEFLNKSGGTYHKFDPDHNKTEDIVLQSLDGIRDKNFCYWHKDDYDDTSRNKQAISVCLFLCFAFYTFLVLLRQKNKENKVSTISIQYFNFLSFHRSESNLTELSTRSPTPTSTFSSLQFAHTSWCQRVTWLRCFLAMWEH